MTQKNRNRALRNLAIAAVLFFVLWTSVDAPLPLASMRMHREERRCLAERSQIVWHNKNTWVGLTPTAVHTYVWTLDVWARNPDGPTLVPLQSYLDYTAGVGGVWGLLAVDPPDGAESARLTVTLSESVFGIESGYSEEYQTEGVREGEFFLFRLDPHHADVEDPLCWTEMSLFEKLPDNFDDRGYFASPYTLEFFNGDGVLIGSYENSKRPLRACLIS